MKLLFSQINKAGITSTVQFFSSMNSDRALPLYSANIKNGNITLHLRTTDFLKGDSHHGFGMEHRSNGTYKL